MNPGTRRVAITGIGLVTPVGNDVATTWDALLAGRSGGAEISIFDASGFPVHIAAEVKGFRDDVIGERRLQKLTTRSHRFAIAAADQALADAGIRPTPEDATRWGCAVGAGMMTSEYVDLAATHAYSGEGGELHADRLLSDPAANDPMVFCRSQATAGISLLTRRYGIRGYATSVHTACASGGQALGTALKLIRRGAADRVLAGGFDSMISPVGIAGFCLLSALSPDNDTPQRASRPVRRHAQRLPAGRRRRLPGAGGVGSRTPTAARASTPSSPATATRCRATGSPIRRRTATARSRRCARRSPTPAPRPPTSITSMRTAPRPA